MTAAVRDIACVAVLAYAALAWLKNTRASSVTIGVVGLRDQRERPARARNVGGTDPDAARVTRVGAR
jgi:hypothetical protein